MSEVVVETGSGKVQGTVENGIFAFKGVPYGESTGGVQRWLPPIRVKPWAGILDATKYGPICPQREIPVIFPGVFETEQKFVQSEDCLVLNIWTPHVGDDSKKPVMVWMHGGAYTSGSGSDRHTDGCSLSRRGDVVVVTINHRLNAFGYLHLADIAGSDYASSGLVGLLDLVLALEWIRDNVAAFGGDNGNVTIFGCSGGGLKVSTLLAMPIAKGLFHKAIIQSGPGLRCLEPEKASAMAESFLAKLGIKGNQIDKLQKVPTKQLLEAFGAPEPMNPNKLTMLALSDLGLTPVLDGHYIPDHPFDPVAAPTAADVPLIIGTTREEAEIQCTLDPRAGVLEELELYERLKPLLGDQMDKIIGTYKRARPEATPWELFVAITGDRTRRASVLLADRKIAASNTPVFMYLFAWRSYFSKNLYMATHGLEGPFVFNNVDMAPQTGTRPDKHELTNSICEAWIAFARTGDPSHSGIPKWERYTNENRETMILDVPCRLALNPDRVELNAWKDFELEL